MARSLLDFGFLDEAAAAAGAGGGRGGAISFPLLDSLLASARWPGVAPGGAPDFDAIMDGGLELSDDAKERQKLLWQLLPTLLRALPGRRDSGPGGGPEAAALRAGIADLRANIFQPGSRAEPEEDDEEDDSDAEEGDDEEEDTSFFSYNSLKLNRPPTTTG